MGIPIGWNIAREDAKQKDVLRADITGQRSPIRRRMRLTRSPRSQSAFDAEFRAATRLSPRHEPPASRSSHARTRLAPPPVPEVSRTAYRANESSREPPSLQREDTSFRRLQTRIDRHARAIETRSAWAERPLPALTPGFAPAAAPYESEAELHRTGRLGASRVPEMDGPTAQAFIEGLMREDQQRLAASRGDAYADDVEDEHESSNNAVNFPPLRRMGRRNIADGPLPASSLRESWSPATTVDGLGDRERSFSPSDESSQWDTFYGTIVPDAVAPTAESSFAAASASFSNSHPSSRAGSSNTSASSSRTHLTVPSRRHSPPDNEQFMRACDTSDDDTASDTEADEDAPPPADATRHRHNPITLRRRSRPSYFSDEPPHRDTERYSRRVMDRTRDASAYVRSFYGSSAAQPRSLRGVMSSPYRSSRDRDRVVDGPSLAQLDGPVDGPLPASDDEVPPLIPINSPALDQELREARSLLERLSRREDVSDDFWASVGLTRSMSDRVESFNGGFDFRPL
jgi:hypothetical protein